MPSLAEKTECGDRKGKGTGDKDDDIFKYGIACSVNVRRARQRLPQCIYNSTGSRRDARRSGGSQTHKAAHIVYMSGLD